ncbi:hypothetical protein [Sphingomonas japonica]|uniref:Uncharacterized protein n=1 Tax=Sphingomonas japonica TaxID=511662 RepID=A0ABX0TZH7_9SPHN|nr:hypothetical protein [Sphingomonas japonica]NIJ23723.1 hypothetical protein [Sphingomonas japonica]
MRRRLRIILLAFFAALVALVFVVPIVQADRCAEAGGTYDRTTLTCRLPTTQYRL